MSGLSYREATPEDDDTVAEFFVKMWLDIGVPQDCLDPQKIQQTLDFIKEARSYDLKIYIAEHNGRPVGSASGHLFHGLYPDVINKKRLLGHSQLCPSCLIRLLDVDVILSTCRLINVDRAEDRLHLGSVGQA